MKDMLKAAGFADIKIEVKENAADIIKGWMPGSGAEDYITSVYITASKPTTTAGVKDDVKKGIVYTTPLFDMAAVDPAAMEAGC